MSTSTLTAKGQTTVPQAIRDALHAQAGTQLQWHLMPDGSLTVRVKNQSLLDMAGMLQAPKGRNVRTEDMRP